MVPLIHKVTTLFKGKGTDVLELTSEDLLRSMSLIVGSEQLLENFAARVGAMIRARSIYVLLIEPITSRYIGKKAKGDRTELLGEMSFGISDRLIKWLNTNKCPLDVTRHAEIVKFLSTAEQEIIEKTDTALVIPLIVAGRLIGVLFVSRKISGVAYTEREIETLSAVASRSALVIEHATLHHMEELKLKKLLHADKLATVGELAAGAAHEIRNPLTTIRSAIQFLQKDLTKEMQLLVDGIIEEVDRIDQIISGLLSFGKSSELKIGPVDIVETLNQTLLMLDSELRKRNIEVEKENEPANATITADESQLKQVFLNVLLNSIQAMPQGGKIILRIKEDPGRQSMVGGKGSICVMIKDTGVGIPEKNLSRVFDPFYTTKETGTGLGLTISYGIVSKHGGEIEIESATEGINTGTAVVISLPKQNEVFRQE
jgi:signal transduction histidine kinase